MQASHKFAGLIPPILREIVRNRKCILFAGAGLSAQAADEEGVHLPLWGDLLERMIDWCIENRVELGASKPELTDILKKKRYLTVAQELQERLGSRIGDCLRQLLQVRKVRPSEAHRLIPNTEWVAVLTSNYDGLLEGAYALHSEGIVPPIFTRNSTGQALNSLRNGQFFIFKVHGDINQPDSIILGDRDYSKILYLEPGYRSFLETLFATYTVLFVGFSADDPDLTAVIERLSALYERSIGQHFLVVPEDAFSAIERRRLLEDKRLDCITYKKDEFHSQVVEFLKAISLLSQQEAPAETLFPRDEGHRLRVFISGSHQNLELLTKIAEVTKKAGFAPWLAESEIRVGDRMVDRIAEAIVECDCMIVVLSEASATSSWVNFETERAFAARKALLPIRVADAPVPAFLRDFVYLQLETPSILKADEEKLIHSLKLVSERVRANRG